MLVHFLKKKEYPDITKSHCYDVYSNNLYPTKLPAASVTMGALEANAQLVFIFLNVRLAGFIDATIQTRSFTGAVDVMDPSDTVLDNTLCIAMEMALCERFIVLRL